MPTECSAKPTGISDGSMAVRWWRISRAARSRRTSRRRLFTAPSSVGVPANKRKLFRAGQPFLGFEVSESCRHGRERVHLEPQSRYRDGSLHYVRPKRNEKTTRGATMARKAARMLGATICEVRGLSDGRLRLVMLRLISSPSSSTWWMAPGIAGSIQISTVVRSKPIPARLSETATLKCLGKWRGRHAGGALEDQDWLAGWPLFEVVATLEDVGLMRHRGWLDPRLQMHLADRAFVGSSG